MKRTQQLVWLCFAVLSMTAVIAQNAKPVYTLVGEWDVAASDARLFEELFAKYQQPLLDGFVQDGTLVEWGFDTTALHTPDGYTHSRWITAESRANLEKAISAVVATYEKLPADQRVKMDQNYDRMIKRHRDYLLESSAYQSKPSQYTNGYFVGSFFQSKPGKLGELQKLWASHMQPVFEQLFNNGVLRSYGVDTELFHTDEPGGVYVWYTLSDMAGEDRVDEAFAAARAKLSEEERQNWAKSLRELTVPEKHRDWLTVIRFNSVGKRQPAS